MRRVLVKLAALFRRRRSEEALSREVAAHLTLLEDEFRGQGMSEQEARLAARRSYGNVELTKELHRDEWRFAWFEALVQDLRAAWRSLRKSPGFAATAIVTLAFGIGANTAIFTMVNGVLLKELPVADPERIVRIKADVLGGLGPDEMPAFSYPRFEELRRQETVFQDVIGVAPRLDTLELDDEQPQVKLDLVTGSFFSFFDTSPALGRLIEESDDEDGSELVCVLAYSAWQRLFRGDPAIVGRRIKTDKVLMRVIGVAPADFIGADLQKQTDVWAPTTAFVGPVPGFNRNFPGLQWLRLLGRLQEGATLDASSAWLRDASPQIEASVARPELQEFAYWLEDGSAGVGEWRGKLNSPLWILMGAVTLVLLVACANLANLLLARMRDRTQEFAVKLAVGIGRERLVRQLFVETLLVVVVGGVAALALASGMTRYMLAVYSERNRSGPFELELPPDPAVLLYAGGVCLLTALIAGLYPAWRASQTGFGLGPAMNAAAELNRKWARRSLIVVQVALGVVLLFGSVLFARSLRNLATADLGYSAERILSVQMVRANPFSHGKAGEPLALADLLERARELPGVASAAYATIGVLEGNMALTQFQVPRPDGETVTLTDVYAINVGPKYFETLQTPLLRGREFGESDQDDGQAVVIVNEALAKKAWPGEDPVGKPLGSRWSGGAQVVGLVADSKYADVREDALPIVYRVFKRLDLIGGTMQVRFRGPATELDRVIRDLVATAAPDFRVSDSSTIEALRDKLISQDRVLAFLSALFGLLSVRLTLVGIYGLISYSVAGRTHEIGVRVSVGAQRSQIVGLVLGEAAALVGLGIGVGLPSALILSTWLESLLFEVAPWDPLHIALTLGILLLGGIAAAYLPTLRATRIHPLEALKCD
jgi:predicted permease